jgi:hypothetical protein
MRLHRGLIIIAALTMLGGCESIDDFVGDALGGFDAPTAPPARRIAVKPSSAERAGPTKTASATGTTGKHQKIPTPAGKVDWIKGKSSRLVMNLSTLLGGTVSHRRFVGKAGRYIEEDSVWRGPGKTPVTAGMLLSESISGPPISDATDPKGTVEHWAVFRGRDNSFGALIGSTNILGPVRWRRGRIGTLTCVTFLQRWADTAANGPVSTLSGYYCAAPGEALTPGEAETVVQSIGIKPQS